MAMKILLSITSLTLQLGTRSCMDAMNLFEEKIFGEYLRFLIYVLVLFSDEEHADRVGDALPRQSLVLAAIRSFACGFECGSSESVDL